MPVLQEAQHRQPRFLAALPRKRVVKLLPLAFHHVRIPLHGTKQLVVLWEQPNGDEPKRHFLVSVIKVLLKKFERINEEAAESRYIRECPCVKHTVAAQQAPS